MNEMVANVSKITWCDEDGHSQFEGFSDFNEWLDTKLEITFIRNNVSLSLAQSSKALYAGDKEAYQQAFSEYRIERRVTCLNQAYLHELCSDDHWFERNEQRFDQLVERILSGDVVPFVGAGISQPGGFKTWKEHLKDQGRTAGIATHDIEQCLAAGQYEQLIDRIEKGIGRDVFVQEIRDSFSKTGTITEVIYILSEMFSDTLITTNYDRLIEQAYDTGGERKTQILTPSTITDAPKVDETTIIKLHGDIRHPAGCILSKEQYDAAYGVVDIDLALPLPSILSYYFTTSSLLFLGCGLNNDRTIDVFKAIKANLTPGGFLPQHFAIEQCPETEAGIVARNAYLAKLGITPIWFQSGQFEFVEDILRMARSEVRYRGSQAPTGLVGVV
ncbi:SIR2 family protein [Mesorhizobium sp. LMG17149]|uniref:SIR2 family NAD-dependent protein deacylase n=1 Tax=Mesorhizobium sp. LMG17149 TaxID=2968497 RepID=UPI002118AF60|nr:SIR2 family protein [Mesorhizobium sp. LMG17149]MCQ8872741.1 SIR2 family protein [Mesorhizobium sp. LMG17149]